jgi:NDP-sugar pyrophosphorylase family protein
MRPLTDTTPKPLIKVSGKPVLDHILAALPDEVTAIIIVTSYLEEQIKAYYGHEWGGRPVSYVTQENPAGGTGDAILSAKELITGRFMVLNGDDIHGAFALQQAVGQTNALISVRSSTPELFGVIEENEDGTLKGIVEKPAHPTSNLVYTGGFVAERSLLDCQSEMSELNEVLVTDMLTIFAQTHPVEIIEQELWISVGYPEDIARAEEILKNKEK